MKILEKNNSLPKIDLALRSKIDFRKSSIRKTIGN